MWTPANGAESAAPVRSHAMAERRAVGGPFHHPLRRGHEGETALRLLSEQPEIGGRIADPEYAKPLDVAPARTNAARDKPSCHGAECLAVKITQIDDVERHERR